VGSSEQGREFSSLIKGVEFFLTNIYHVSDFFLSVFLVITTYSQTNNANLIVQVSWLLAITLCPIVLSEMLAPH
jgi:hypothetical protein